MSILGALFVTLAENIVEYGREGNLLQRIGSKSSLKLPLYTSIMRLDGAQNSIFNFTSTTSIPRVQVVIKSPAQ